MGKLIEYTNEQLEDLSIALDRLSKLGFSSLGGLSLTVIEALGYSPEIASIFENIYLAGFADGFVESSKMIGENPEEFDSESVDNLISNITELQKYKIPSLQGDK